MPAIGITLERLMLSRCLAHIVALAVAAIVYQTLACGNLSPTPITTVPTTVSPKIENVATNQNTAVAGTQAPVTVNVPVTPTTTHPGGS